jgi:hypothetical protein
MVIYYFHVKGGIERNMKELEIEINDLIKNIDQITIKFYQQHTEDGYLMLNDTLAMIMKVVERLSEYKTNNSEKEIDIAGINQVLSSALYALEEKDTILFSDVLQYELKALLEHIIRI